MAKKFQFKGKSLEELQKLSVEEFTKLLPTNARRKVGRGFTEQEEKFLKQLRKDPEKIVRTHCRSMLVLPEMVGRRIAVYNGKKFKYVDIVPEMIGQRFGTVALTRKGVKHSAAGIGATRSTKFISVK